MTRWVPLESNPEVCRVQRQYQLISSLLHLSFSSFSTRSAARSVILTLFTLRSLAPQWAHKAGLTPSDAKFQDVYGLDKEVRSSP